MGPHLMLDKSTIQSLSHDELDVLRKYFYLVVPPVLLLEIIGDLRKVAVGDRNPTVRDLARRIVPGASLPIMPNYRKLIRAELDGVKIRLDHRPVVFGGRALRTEAGECGTELSVQPEATALMRWQQGEFSAGEELLSERYRDAIRAIDIASVQRRLSAEYSPRLKLLSLEQAAQFVDDLLAGAESRSILEWFFAEMMGHDKLVAVTLKKYPAKVGDGGFPQFLTHCLRTSLLFHYALAFGLVSARVTNRIDLEYLFYLPFTLGFSSGDKFHHQLFEFVRWPKSDFVERHALKTDLGRIMAHLRDNPDSLDLVRPPHLSDDSFTSMMWAKHMKSTSERRDDLMKRLTNNDEQRLIQHVKNLMKGETENTCGTLETEDFLIRHLEVSTAGPCICGSGKSFKECHGKNL